MRFGLLLTVGGLVLMFMGGRAIYEAAASGSQKTISFTQFVQQRPGIGWYKITNASWDLSDCIYVMEKSSSSSSTGTVEKVYVPVHAEGAPLGPSDKVTLIMETEREDLRGLLNRAEQGGKASLQPGDEKLLHYDGSLNGTIVFGGDLDSSDHDKMAEKFGSQLDTRYVVLQDGNKPNAWKGIAALLGGIVLTPLGLMVLFGRNRS